VPVLAPALRERYDLSLTQIGVALAAESVGLTLALLPWGLAADRWGERWTLALGLGGCAACLVGAAFAPSYASLVVFLGLAGIAGGSVQSGSGRAVMRWFGPDRRGLALGVRQTAVPVGGAVAALALPLLDGARAGFLFLAALVAAGAVVGALVLRPAADGGLESRHVEPVLRERRLWLMSAASGLYLVAQVALIGFVVLFLHDERGFTTGEAALVLAVAQLLAAVLRIGVGHLSDGRGSRVVPLRVVGLAIAATLVGVSVSASAPVGLLVPTLVVATALSMAWNGLSFTIAAELGGRRSGAAIGVQQTVLSAVAVVVPVAFAASVAATSWRAAFAIAAVFPVAGWALLAPLRRG
jgi:nitrate/nitrite transporter NarK